MNRDIWSFSGFVASLVSLLLAVTVPLAATATLTGTVTDEQGKVVVNVA